LPMTIMVISTYPPKKGPEVGKIFVQNLGKKLPPFLKRIEVYNTGCDEGIRVYAIYEIQDDKVADGIREITARMVPFHEVEGYRWRSEILLKATESLAMIGLAPPK
jgi:hypothetical protein